MANFIVRVELIDVIDNSQPLYGRLHVAMQDAGFKKTIGLQGHNFRYEFPDAEYFIRTDISTSNVRDTAKNTVEQIWKKFRILVVEANDVSGYNLRQVNE